MEKQKLIQAISPIQLRLSKWIPGLLGRYWANRFMTPTRHVRPDWEKELLKSATAHQLEDGVRYWTWGQQGPWVFLVHGWDGRGTQLGKLIEPLLATGFRIAAWDGPAHGDSPGKQTHVMEHVRSLMLLEKTLAAGSVRSLVGHSFGGAVVAMAAHRGLHTESIVLLAAPSSLQRVFHRFCDWIGLADSAKKAFQIQLETRSGLKADQAEIAHFERISMRARALIVHAPNDRDVPYSEAQRIHEGWPNSKLLTVPHGGHRRFLKDPKTIQAIADFIRGNESSLNPMDRN